MSTALQMRPLEYVVVQVCLPGARPENAGILLLDRDSDTLHVKLRQDWASFAGEEADVLAGLEETLVDMGRVEGGSQALARLSDLLSGVVRATDSQTTMGVDAEARLRRLYRENVNAAGAIPVRSWRAAAGGLSDEQEAGEVIGTVDPPAGVRATEGMFAAFVEGRSMEPLIPDGSLCLFRPAPAGSRNGRRLLVQRRGVSDSTAQLTVKTYRSEKSVDEDGNWRHDRIRMVPLNPDFEAWDLTPDEFGVLGEFVCVLPAEE